MESDSINPKLNATSVMDWDTLHGNAEESTSNSLLSGSSAAVSATESTVAESIQFQSNQESVQNQALMAEITDASSSEILKDVKSKLCSQSCLEIVRKYRDHNQVMCDSIKKLDQSRRESSLVIANLEEQIKSYQANAKK
ncbi:hypothetical protein OSB04_006252 [Centaurea solstitialis]|uniref:Uncharacterized protein n=1 Tax=Centaurea solstitialis TaxID=347529 RepID=A0AA38WHH9_9ASTR|nr:hypothetical protein OSB04_006252 [Centaurea solstitialis]